MKPSLTHLPHSATMSTYQNSWLSHIMERWTWEKLSPASRDKILVWWEPDLKDWLNIWKRKDTRDFSLLDSVGVFGSLSKWHVSSITLLPLLECIHHLECNKFSVETQSSWLDKSRPQPLCSQQATIQLISNRTEKSSMFWQKDSVPTRPEVCNSHKWSTDGQWEEMSVTKRSRETSKRQFMSARNIMPSSDLIVFNLFKS